jgi:glycosyltransferase involved in cell wall biosynthesis
MQIICLTPVKNEAWILDRFLQCASSWADSIIIADQGSTDGSRDIAKKYPKVRLIENPESKFQGTGMRRLLLHESRKIKGSKLLIALDADEVLSADLFNSPDWNAVKSAAPGTRIHMKIANLFPDVSHFYTDDAWYYLGFIDDGASDIEGSALHEPRLPYLPQNPSINIEQARFLHYNYLNKNRNASKLRWYMCYERVNNQRTFLEILKQYFAHHHPEYLGWKQKLYSIPPSFLSGYQQKGIDMETIQTQNHYWWDQEILNYFEDNGTGVFRGLDIWYVDWNKTATKLGVKLSKRIHNPQRFTDRLALAIFKGINKHPRNYLLRAGMRGLQYLNY